MAEYRLRASPPLGNIRRDFPNLTIEEVSGRTLVSVTARLNGLAALKEAVRSAFDLSLPAPGKVALSESPPGRGMGSIVFMGMGPEQFLMMFDDTGDDPCLCISQEIGQSGYIVDQSDGWAMIRMTGENSRPALERICMLDLDPARFSPGCVARTVMEHLSAIILCETPDRFLLMSPRSSAGSFWHALETSARNIG